MQKYYRIEPQIKGIIKMEEKSYLNQIAMKKYATLFSALKECQDIAKYFPKMKFIVMESVYMYSLAKKSGEIK